MKNLLIIFIVVLLSGCINNAKKEAGRLVSLSKEHFVITATIKDDSLESAVEINTLNGFQEKRGLVGVVWDDSFLRAYINKETGDTIYQVYDVSYMKDWSFIHSVNYESESGLKTQRVTKILSNVETCSSNPYIGCKLREDVAWEVDRKTLDFIADSNPNGVWRYKLKAKKSHDRNRVITTAEVAGFLDAVDMYKNKNGYADSNNHSAAFLADEYARGINCISQTGGSPSGELIDSTNGVHTFAYQCTKNNILIECDDRECRNLN